MDLLLFVWALALVVGGSVRIARSNLAVWSWYVAGSLLATLVGVQSEAVDLGGAVGSVLVDAYLGLVLIAVAALVAASPRSLQRFSRAYVVAAAASSTVVLFIHYSGLDLYDVYRDEYRVRLRGTFNDPNVLGPYLAIALVCLLVTAPNEWSRGRRLLLAAPCLGLLFLTYSRGGYVALLVSLSVAAGASAARQRREQQFAVRFALGAIGLTGVVAAAVAAPALNLSLGANASSRLQAQAYDTDRFSLFRDATAWIARNPWGLGPGSFGDEFGVNPHNLFLGKAVDSGLLAAILVCGVLILAMSAPLSVFMRSGDRTSLMLASALAGQVVVSFVIYSHHWRHLALWAGAALGYARADRRARLAASPRQRSVTK